jgi:hypothetical protein
MGGCPRPMKVSSVRGTWKMCLIWFWIWCQQPCWTLFLILTSYEADLSVGSFVRFVEWCVFLLDLHIRRSSANRRELIGEQFDPSLIPARSTSVSSCWRSKDNSFTARTKRYGDRGHPWRVPRVLEFFFICLPINYNIKPRCGNARMDKFNEMTVQPLPVRADTMKLHLSLLKALARSILSIKALFFMMIIERSAWFLGLL